MAKPIAFKPPTVDFKADLQRRLEKAPDEHAAALLPHTMCSRPLTTKGCSTFCTA